MINLWKDIIGWEKYYEISNTGDIRNKQTKKIICGDKNNSGYRRVCLYNKNHVPNKQRFFVHRLVAIHFLPNPNNLPEVNHKDLNKDHNYSINLEWISRKDNELHSRKFGLKEYKPFKVTYFNGDMHIYNSKNELGILLNVTKGCIKHWLHNKNKGYKKYNIKNIEYI